MSALEVIENSAAAVAGPFVSYREPTGPFLYSQVKDFFFRSAPPLSFSSQIRRGYNFAISCMVQLVRKTGSMYMANVMGSMLTDFGSICKLVSARKSPDVMPEVKPKNVSDVIVLYLPSKDGHWSDWKSLHKMVENKLKGCEAVAAFIESWDGGGNMKSIHIQQVQEVVIQIKRKFPENPLMVVGWSHGAEIIPWSFLHPESYNVDNGTICTHEGDPQMVKSAMRVDHVFRLCSPMTEKEAILMDKLGITFTEVCASFDPLLPQMPVVDKSHQAWVDTGHLGAVFSPFTAALLANKVAQLSRQKTAKDLSVA